MVLWNGELKKKFLELVVLWSGFVKSMCGRKIKFLATSWWLSWQTSPEMAAARTARATTKTAWNMVNHGSHYLDLITNIAVSRVWTMDRLVGDLWILYWLFNFFNSLLISRFSHQCLSCFVWVDEFLISSFFLFSFDILNPGTEILFRLKPSAAPSVSTLYSVMTSILVALLTVVLLTSDLLTKHGPPGLLDLARNLEDAREAADSAACPGTASLWSSEIVAIC